MENRPPGGMASAAIAALDSFPYSDAHLRDKGITDEQLKQGLHGPVGDKGLPECAVCHEDFEAANPCRKLPCGHFFHTWCIDPWLRRQATCAALALAACPLCCPSRLGCVLAARASHVCNASARGCIGRPGVCLVLGVACCVMLTCVSFDRLVAARAPSVLCCL